MEKVLSYLISAAIVVVAILFASITQEIARELAAYYLAKEPYKKANRPSLNPLTYLDPYSSILVPFLLYLLGLPVLGGAKRSKIDYANLKWDEWGAAIVGSAGPLANFLSALIFFLIGNHLGSLYGPSGEIVALLFQAIIQINLSFMLFNLIPIPPLDGSYLLYAISPNFFRDFMRKIEPYGTTIYLAVIIIIVWVFPGFFVSCIDKVLQLFQHLL